MSSNAPLGKNAREVVENGQVRVIVTHKNGKERPFMRDTYTKMFNNLRAGKASSGGSSQVSSTVPKSSSHPKASSCNYDGGGSNREREHQSFRADPPQRSGEIDNSVVRTLEALTKKVSQLSESKSTSKNKGNAKSSSKSGGGHRSRTTRSRSPISRKPNPKDIPHSNRDTDVIENIQMYKG